MKNTKLSEDTLLLSIALITISLVFTSILAILIMGDLKICWHYQCFTEILDIFKLPISFAAAGLAGAAFRATIFKSNQTQFQLTQTAQQNVFRNYIDHKNEFIEMLEKFEKVNNVKILDKTRVYRGLFPNNNTTNMEFRGQYEAADDSGVKDGNKKYEKYPAAFQSTVFLDQALFKFNQSVIEFGLQCKKNNNEEQAMYDLVNNFRSYADLKSFLSYSDKCYKLREEWVNEWEQESYKHIPVSVYKSHVKLKMFLGEILLFSLPGEDENQLLTSLTPIMMSDFIDVGKIAIKEKTYIA